MSTTSPLTSPLTSAPPWLQGALRLAGPLAAGAGALLMVASQWGALERLERLGLLALLLLLALGASCLERLAAPALSLSFLALGALLAAVGQAYQLGGDPWQLFAYWALLSLPWALCARTEALWALWALVACLSAGLWAQQTDHAHPARSLLISLALPLALRSWRWALRVSLLGALLSFAAGTQGSYGPSLLGVSALCVGLVGFKPRERLLVALCLLTLTYLLDIKLVPALSQGPISALALVALSLWGAERLYSLSGSRGAGAAPKEEEPTPAPRASRGDILGDWPRLILTSLGALTLSTIFLWALFSAELLTRHTLVPWGALFTLAAWLLARHAGAGERARPFREALAVSAGLAGLVGMELGLLLNLSGSSDVLSASGPSLIITAGLAAHLLRGTWGAPLFGAAVGGGLLLCLFALARPFSYPPSPSLVLLALPALLALRWERAREWRGALSGLAVCLICALIIASGRSLLLSGLVTARGASPLTEWRTPLGLLGASFAALGGRAWWGAGLTARLLLTAAAGAALVAPTLGGALLSARLLSAAGREHLARFALLAALWALGSLYYSLSLPLGVKGLLLALVGCALMAARWAEGPRGGARAPLLLAPPRALALVAAGALQR